MNNINYNALDYDGFREMLIKTLKEKIPEYTDFSKSDVGIVLIELLSHGLDVLSMYNDLVANESFLSTARLRESVFKLTEQMGYTMYNSTASRFLQVFEIEPRDKVTTIPKGFRLNTKASMSEEEVYFELEEDLRIPPNCTGLEKDEQGEYLYTIPIIQGESIRNELVGGSVGTPDQSFILESTDIIIPDLEVYVYEEEEVELWTRVDNFIDSKPYDKHYKAERDERGFTKIIFGNNHSGKIPSVQENSIYVNYRVGGGSKGNVKPNSITEMESKKTYMERTFNPYEAYDLGVDEESIESAKIKAPANLRTLWRAVTIFDFKDLGLTLPDVLLTNAEVNKEEKRVDVYVLPKNSEYMSDEYLEYIQNYYEERALIGIDVKVHQPVFKEVDVTLHVRLQPKFTEEMVKPDIKQALEDLFRLGNFPFGEGLYASDISSELMNVVGVKAVNVLEPSDDIEEVKAGEIIKLGIVDIVMAGDRRA